MRKIKIQIFFSFLIASLLVISPVFAHPGRTDAYGCHTCRTNCAKWGLSQGEYHCHNAKALSQPKEPIKSHYSDTGGYTTPAPEYKVPKQPTIKQPENQQTQSVSQNAILEKPQKESMLRRLYNFLFN